MRKRSRLSRLATAVVYAERTGRDPTRGRESRPHFHLCRCGRRVECGRLFDECPGAKKVRSRTDCDRCERPAWYRWLDRLKRTRKRRSA